MLLKQVDDWHLYAATQTGENRTGDGVAEQPQAVFTPISLSMKTKVMQDVKVGRHDMGCLH